MGYLATLRVYFWPEGRIDLKIGLVLALASLAAAKGINILVPFLCKGIVDALSGNTAILALPLGLILACGGARLLQQLAAEFGDFIFTRVA